jgi:hypothetical protein
MLKVKCVAGERGLDTRPGSVRDRTKHFRAVRLVLFFLHTLAFIQVLSFHSAKRSRDILTSYPVGKDGGSAIKVSETSSRFSWRSL